MALILKLLLNSPQCVGLSSLISPQSLSPSHRYERGMQMLVDWHFVCSGWQVLSAEMIINFNIFTISYSHFDLNISLCFISVANGILTAVLFIRGPVVIAVVDAIANIVLCNAAAIVASELGVGVTGSEETAHLVTVVSTVVIVVAAVVVGHTTPIATSKHCWLAGVEGCQSE